MGERSTSYGEQNEKLVDRVLASLRRRQVLRHVPDNGVAVDLGCGHRGELLVRLAPRLREGIGFDLNVQPTPPAHNVRLERRAADEPLPLADDSVDLVTCIAVIEHVERPVVLLEEARRMLRPGGKLVVTTPSTHARPLLERVLVPLRLIDPQEIRDHKRYYSPATLRRDIEAAGFRREAVRIRRFELGLNLAAVARA